MSATAEDDILKNPLNREMSAGIMGNLQRSINRSLEIAQNSERTYLPGETKSTNHLIFEMNEFYIEMAQKINELKLHRYDNFNDDDEDVEDTDSVLYEVVTAIRKKRNDPEMKKQIETVLKLDQMMENSFKTLKEERLERQRVQQQLCDIIDKEDNKYSRTRFFRNLCECETNKCNSQSSVQTNRNLSSAETDTSHASHAKSQQRSEPKKDDKFIKRNIQLAKNTPTMSNPAYSLTDEEKVKLDKLLTDIDKDDKTQESDLEFDDINFLENENDSDYLLGLDDSTTIYPFSLSQQDQTRMRELERELENLSEVSLLPSKQKTTTHKPTGGKPWQNEDRLKQIDEKLEKLQSERESFSFEPTEVTLPQGGLEEEMLEDNDDTANDVESIPYDTIRERSQEMLDRIASIVQKGNAEYSDHEHDEPERD